MPPRLPHRMVTTAMSLPEKGVLAVLGVSVTVGLAQMGSDIFRAVRNDENGDSGEKRPSSACPMNWGSSTDGSTKK